MTAQAKKSLFSTGNLTRMAILAAVSAVLALIEIPIGMPFYKLDLSNIPVLIGAFALGPVPGAIILLVKNLIGLIHTSSAGIGKLADFIMGLAMILPASIIYQRNKTRKSALIGMLVGVATMVVVSVFVNKWIMLPFYMTAFHMDMAALVKSAKWSNVNSEWELLLLITAPFNLIKGTVISVVTFLLYKPLSGILHGKV